jgi:hypothetical protein
VTDFDKHPPHESPHARDPEYEDFRAAIEARRRDISDEQLRRFEGYAAEMFAALGMDLGTPSTEDIPSGSSEPSSIPFDPGERRGGYLPYDTAREVRGARPNHCR